METIVRPTAEKSIQNWNNSDFEVSLYIMYTLRTFQPVLEKQFSSERIVVVVVFFFFLKQWDLKTKQNEAMVMFEAAFYTHGF